MKKSNLFLVVFLVISIVIGWGVQVSGIIRTASQINQYLEQAAVYEKEGLYQKAIESLESALSLDEKEEIRLQWLDTYERAYKDEVIAAKKYAEAISKMCELNEGNPVYWEKLLQLYSDRNDLKNVYETYQKVQKEGITSELIVELGDKAQYAVRETKKAYLEVKQSISGYFTVKDNDGWGVINPKGDTTIDCKYEYIGPYNKNNVSLRKGEKGSRLVTSKNVVEAIIEIDYIQAGAYADGMLPLCIEEGTWQYYDCKQGKLVLDTYEMVSNFSQGVAAVCKDGKWKLINSNGENIGSSFDDIKLHSDGSYVNDGIMIAAVNGNYDIYNAKGEKLSALACADMDVFMGDAIAYKDASGKWGYVNKNGEIVIKPQFDQAKSFSGGLGAVCKENLWGFAKKNGKIVIECQYIDGGYFNKNGICFVSIYEGNYHKIQLRY